MHIFNLLLIVSALAVEQKVLVSLVGDPPTDSSNLKTKTLELKLLAQEAEIRSLKKQPKLLRRSCKSYFSSINDDQRSDKSALTGNSPNNYASTALKKQKVAEDAKNAIKLHQVTKKLNESNKRYEALRSQVDLLLLHKEKCDPQLLADQPLIEILEYLKEKTGEPGEASNDTATHYESNKMGGIRKHSSKSGADVTGNTSCCTWFS